MMRIWDVHPGYLNQQCLIEEHRDIHALVTQFNTKKNNALEPEALRWLGHGWAIKLRHRWIEYELKLCAYADSSPINTKSNKGVWPSVYIDEPHVQFALLKEKYKDSHPGRISLPRNEQELWRQHKYSVLARDQKLYKEIGRNVSNKGIDFKQLSRELVDTLRRQPDEGGIRNALQHMWGYVSEVPNDKNNGRIASWSLKKLLTMTQENAIRSKQPYLLNSTALSELMAWL